MYYFGGISDLSDTWSLQRQQSVLKKNLQIASRELTTGLKDVSKVANAGDLGRVFSIDQSLALLDRYKQSTDVGRTRMDAVQETLTSIHNVAQDVTLGVLTSVGAGGYKSIQIQADGARPALDAMFGRLNSNVAGHSLFAGAAIDGSALSDVETLVSDVEAIVLAAPDIPTAMTNVEAYFNTPGGGFETNIYVGSVNDAPRIGLAEGDSIEGGVRADAQALRDTMRSLSLIAVAARNTATMTQADRTSLMKSASEVQVDVGDDIILLQERVGYNQERLERAAVANEASRTRLGISRADLMAADPYDAAGRLQELQTQLDTLFTITARLGNLSLVNYIR